MFLNFAFIINFSFQAAARLTLFQVFDMKLFKSGTHSSAINRKSQSQNRWEIE